MAFTSLIAVGDQEGDYLITRLPLKHLLESLCNDTFDDPATRKTHKTMDLFERPYEEDELPGYTTIIENPICLKDIRNRWGGGRGGGAKRRADTAIINAARLLMWYFYT